MAIQTYERGVSYIGKVFDSVSKQWADDTITKTACFKELNRVDRSQHKLHFKLIAILEDNMGEDTEEGRLKISTDGLYDLTAKAIKTLLVVDDKFTESDRTELLNDSIAILEFGMWFMKEKVPPFFNQFSMTSK